jgi:MFS transporter, DHA1 family, inner membrane transport protein
MLAPARERVLLWLLALTQFTVIMDFMVMMPLGPQIMKAFAIGPAGFAAAVSAYAWCSGLTGLFAATYIDRFDRRRLLMVVFSLFLLSNLGCALASDFHLLLFARAFAGLTGGVLGPIVFAIVGDVIPESRRGAAMGLVMTSFSIASIVGVPAGVALGAHFGWQSAFELLVVFCAVIWIGALRIVPSLTSHLAKSPTPLAQVIPNLYRLIVKPSHVRAFVLVLAMVTSNMLIVPFISPVLVANLGIAPDEIPYIYIAGGIATLFTARWLGRMADRYGKVRVFRYVAAFSILPVLVVTHLPTWPLLAIVAFFPFFMVAMSGRFIPMQALMTSVPDAPQRGAFMSITTAMQSLGAGAGAWFGGLLLGEGVHGEILGYGMNGWIAAVLTVFGMIWISRVVSNTASCPAPVAAVPVEAAVPGEV